MSLAILFHFLYTQHVSDINISIIRSLRLCCNFLVEQSGFPVKVWMKECEEDGRTREGFVLSLNEKKRESPLSPSSRIPSTGLTNKRNIVKKIPTERSQMASHPAFFHKQNRRKEFSKPKVKTDCQKVIHIL